MIYRDTLYKVQAYKGSVINTAKQRYCDTCGTGGDYCGKYRELDNFKQVNQKC